MSNEMTPEQFYEAIHKHVDTPLIESAKATGDGEDLGFSYGND